MLTLVVVQLAQKDSYQDMASAISPQYKKLDGFSRRGLFKLIYPTNAKRRISDGAYAAGLKVLP
jgi:hypothetical protein